MIASINFVEMLPQLTLVNYILPEVGNEAAAMGLATQVDVMELNVAMGARGPQAPQVPTASAGVVGRAFQKIDGGRVVAEIKVDRNSIAFAIEKYERWAEFIADFQRLVNDAMLTQLLGFVGVAVIRLEYFDRFLFSGDAKKAPVAELLDFSGPWAAPHALTASATGQMWHSHFGQFVKTSDGLQRLINVNVECVDANRPSGVVRTILIRTFGEDRLLPSDGYSGAPSGVLKPAYIRERLDDLHTTLKNLFAQTITPEYRTRVGLV
ncbi:TIGR04255 family protein [Oharaeibacter diazotrophicus]|uniref:TIGR04255 family protein n=1 Tax=Oharaeibacter diazotrophicus TaxID=1920512 RepID=UPI0013F63323|nr:TIGR04255 family protein [Oharaeibacter diazotrophicus]